MRVVILMHVLFRSVRSVTGCWNDPRGKLIADVNRARAEDIAQLAGVECGNQLAFAAKARSELLHEANHLALFDVAVIGGKTCILNLCQN